MTPTYWVMRGFRSVILAGEGVGSLLLPIAILLAMTIALAALSLARLRLADAKISF